ncbi:MAG: hypothetical protein JWM57_4197 [Phycisphaerales bacterium]|nr:hypothetical protein [Phycisphaerales bacterium]
MQYLPEKSRFTRWTASLAAASLAFGAFGCGGAPGTSAASPTGNAPGQTVADAGTVAGQATPGAGRSAAAAVPNDARYTIFCCAFTGPARVQQATVSKDNLFKATGHREFYVVHEEAQSTLYYGYYKERERTINASEAARANKDLEYVRGLGDGEGHRIFPRSLVVPLPLAEPEGPPEFDLTKLDQNKSPDDPSRRYWSLAIADYTNDARIGDKNRKQIVIEAVIEARKQGVEAYYYNGTTTSTVCIGAWPRTAIREQDAGEAKTLTDSGHDIIVSNGPVNPEIAKGLRAAGREVDIFQPKVQFNDPTLEATWKKWVSYSVNGETVVEKTTDPTTKAEVKSEKTSFLFAIPQTAPASLLAGNRNTTEAQDTGPTVVNPLSPTASPSGRLRSVTP